MLNNKIVSDWELRHELKSVVGLILKSLEDLIEVDFFDYYCSDSNYSDVVNLFLERYKEFKAMWAISLEQLESNPDSHTLQSIFESFHEITGSILSINWSNGYWCNGYWNEIE